MKRFTNLLFVVSIAALPLASCADTAGEPLPKPGSSIPNDDGKLFEPGIPPSNPGNEQDKANPDSKAPIQETDEKTTTVTSGAGTKDGNGGGGPNAPVPEPSTLLLVGAGVAGIALLARRRRRNGQVEHSEEA